LGANRKIFYFTDFTVKFYSQNPPNYSLGRTHTWNLISTHGSARTGHQVPDPDL